MKFPVQFSRLTNLTLAALLAMPAGVSAQTINFGALLGSNGALFSTYTESGFTVERIEGSICVARYGGNPAPGLSGGVNCGQSTSSTLRVTRTAGGLFRFMSTDLSTANGPTLYESPATSSYTFAGYLATIASYSVSSNFSLAGGTVANFASPAPATDIDELRISLNTGGSDTRTYDIDNIALSTSTVVPEPSTIVLMGAGLMGLLAVARRRTT